MEHISPSDATLSHLPVATMEQPSVENKSPLLSDQEYLAKFKINEIFERMRERILVERPSNPIGFLSTYLDHLSMQKRFQFENSSAIDVMDFASPSVVTSTDIKEDLIMRESLAEIKDLEGLSFEPNSPVKLLKKVLRLRSEEDSGDHLKLAVGLDVGGSLAKIVFYEPPNSSLHYAREIGFLNHSLTYGSSGVRDAELSFSWKKGKFHFLNFETRKFEGAIEMLKFNELLKNEKVLLATGGGAQKYANMIRRELGCQLAKGDELACLLLGVNFLLQHLDDELFYLEDMNHPETSAKIPCSLSSEGTFPYLLGLLSFQVLFF